MLRSYTSKWLNFGAATGLGQNQPVVNQSLLLKTASWQMENKKINLVDVGTSIVLTKKD